MINNARQKGDGNARQGRVANVLHVSLEFLRHDDDAAAAAVTTTMPHYACKDGVLCAAACENMLWT